jgi:DNA-binding NtrC family response regulator
VLTRNKPIAIRKSPKASVSARILVVDDERRVADSVAFMLEHEGYSVRVAYSGADAINIAREFKPMLVLADVVMPEMNGVDTAKEICEAVPSCKAMLFSGHAEGRQLAQDAQTQGQNFEFIEKPTHPTEMLLKIRFALAI